MKKTTYKAVLDTICTLCCVATSAAFIYLVWTLIPMIINYD